MRKIAQQLLQKRGCDAKGREVKWFSLRYCLFSTSRYLRGPRVAHKSMTRRLGEKRAFDLACREPSRAGENDFPNRLRLARQTHRRFVLAFYWLEVLYRPCLPRVGVSHPPTYPFQLELDYYPAKQVQKTTLPTDPEISFPPFSPLSQLLRAWNRHRPRNYPFSQTLTGSNGVGMGGRVAEYITPRSGADRSNPSLTPLTLLQSTVSVRFR